MDRGGTTGGEGNKEQRPPLGFRFNVKALLIQGRGGINPQADRPHPDHSPGTRPGEGVLNNDAIVME